MRKRRNRRSSRSLVVLHARATDPFGLPNWGGTNPRSARRGRQTGVRRPGNPRALWLERDREKIVHMVEDLLTVGLVVAWDIDLVIGGPGGATVPVILVLLTGLGLYRVWRRRRPGRDQGAEDLMILRS